MESKDIKLSDWSRILVGEVPAGFYVEVVFRTIFVFVLLIVAMRLLGKRMASQINRNELVALVSLAAAIGACLHDPERGLLPAVLVAIIIICISRGIALLAYKKPKFEVVAVGDFGLLVKDGVLQMKEIRKSNLSRERVLAQVRSMGVKNLGRVKRLYLEAGGTFSIIKASEGEGLNIIPPDDIAFYKKQQASSSLVCESCGAAKTTLPQCPNCGSETYTAAIR